MKIDLFPGKKEKIRQKYVLTDEQKAWLTKWHPITENKVLEQMSGYTHVTLARFVKEIGLKKSDEGFKAIMQRKGERLRNLRQKERRRILFGLPQQTRMHVVLEAYNHAQHSCRCRAIEKGYVLSSECGEGSLGRWLIYYDDETPRDDVFERNCNKNGFRIEEWKEE